MSKSVKSVIIAAAALLVLGAALLILMLTKPKSGAGEESSQPTTTSVAAGNAYVIDKKADLVTSIKVQNADGTYTFTRQKRVVSETNESGEVTSRDEYYWTSSDLKGIPQNDSTVRSFISNLSSLPQKSAVEDNAGDLEKYGLTVPQSTALLTFEDGTSALLRFGIENPADASSVYFALDNSNDVKLVNYYAVERTFSDVKQFAQLTMTEAFESEGKSDLKSLVIKRADLETPVEIRFMSELSDISEDESLIVSSFNTHRFVTPVTAEVDVTKGNDVCYKMYGLTMAACEYLEKNEENMSKCGLDDPQTEVSFKYGGKEYRLLIGSEIREEITSSDASNTLSTVTGYYAVMDGVPGIYSIDPESVPWCTFKVSDLISRRPLSPYIYAVDSVEITVPGGTYKFDIDGESKRFFCGDKELVSEEFRGLYQTLIGSVGEEMYTGEADGGLFASVKFNYNSKYHEIYGAASDTISYYESDGRKCVVVLNGTPIFKVRKIYADRLVENVDALLNGGNVRTDW
ncbi:MAG: DUF4340 domain-containing protein [Oscillospiraceae bacterium]|nr:DUF4340 domain-containing protein [Oscillospiraceae bacterium]